MHAINFSGAFPPAQATTASHPRLAGVHSKEGTSLLPAEMQKLKKAASEFEAMLLQHWWSAMKDSGISSGGDEFDAGHDTLDQMGMQAMSTAVAQGGGLGLAALMVKGLLSNMGTHAADAGAK
jgi:Rod binding domain-containing protein